MKTALSIGSLLALPVVAAVVFESASQWLIAECEYGTTSFPFAIGAIDDTIPTNGSTDIVAANGECPLNWSIISQPGGWKITSRSDGTATLEPISGSGNSGTVVVRAEDSQSKLAEEQVQTGAADPNCTCDCPDFLFGPLVVRTPPLITGFRNPVTKEITFRVKHATEWWWAVLKNPGEAGWIGHVYEMQSGTWTLETKQVDADDWALFCNGDVDLCEKLTKPAYPISDGCVAPNNYCPFSLLHVRTFTPGSGWDTGGPTCSMAKVPCRGILTAFFYDAPEYPFWSLPRKATGTHTWNEYIAWFCESAQPIRKIVAKHEKTSEVTVTYKSESPCPYDMISGIGEMDVSAWDVSWLITTTGFSSEDCSTNLCAEVDCLCQNGIANNIQYETTDCPD